MERRHILHSILALDAAGLQARQTKDLDIVVSLEGLTPDFVKTFWAFVIEGGYEHRQASTGKNIFYRFAKPTDTSYPFMLELFSRAADDMWLPSHVHLAPIPTDDEVSSLSAILLDTHYYDFLHRHKTTLDGLSILSAAGLIPLKAKAWLDLSERKSKGERIDSRNIRKHRTDVLNLYRLMNPQTRVPTPNRIKNDLSLFLDALAKDEFAIADFLRQTYLK